MATNAVLLGLQMMTSQAAAAAPENDDDTFEVGEGTPCVICLDGERCQFASTLIADAFPPSDHFLNEHLWTIFVLRHILQFSPEECEELLQKSFGLNPGQWCAFCSHCSELVRYAFDIYRQIVLLEKQFNSVRNEVCGRLEESFCKDAPQIGGTRERRKKTVCFQQQIRDIAKKISNNGTVTRSGRYVKIARLTNRIQGEEAETLFGIPDEDSDWIPPVVDVEAEELFEHVEANSDATSSQKRQELPKPVKKAGSISKKKLTRFVSSAAPKSVKRRRMDRKALSRTSITNERNHRNSQLEVRSAQKTASDININVVDAQSTAGFLTDLVPEVKIEVEENDTDWLPSADDLSPLDSASDVGEDSDILDDEDWKPSNSPKRASGRPRGSLRLSKKKSIADTVSSSNDGKNDESNSKSKIQTVEGVTDSMVSRPKIFKISKPRGKSTRIRRYYYCPKMPTPEDNWELVNESGKEFVRCKQCTRLFKSRKSYQQHERKRLRYPSLSCLQIPKRVPPRRKPKMPTENDEWELLNEDGQEKIRCKPCGRVLGSRVAFAHHYRKHQRNPSHPLIVFQCQECSYTSKTYSGAACHRKWHKIMKHFDESSTTIGFFRCKHCQLEVDIKTRQRHLKEEHPSECGETVQLCHLCDKTLSSRSSLQQHLRDVHIDKEMRKHKCEICGAGFTRKEAYDDHYARCMNAKLGIPNDPNKFICETCGRGCSSKQTLRLHKRKTHPKNLSKIDTSGMTLVPNDHVEVLGGVTVLENVEISSTEQVVK